MCIPGRIEIGSIGFCGEGKTEEPRKKTSQSKERTKTELYQHDASSVNRTRAILVGDGRYQHCQFEPNIIFLFLLLRIKNPLMLYILLYRPFPMFYPIFQGVFGQSLCYEYKSSFILI